VIEVSQTGDYHNQLSASKISLKVQDEPRERQKVVDVRFDYEPKPQASSKWLELAQGKDGKTPVQYLQGGIACDGYRLHVDNEDTSTQNDNVRAFLNSIRAKLQYDNLCKFSVQNRHLQTISNVALACKPEYMTLNINGALHMHASSYELETRFSASNGDAMGLNPAKERYWLSDNNQDIFTLTHTGEDGQISISPKFVNQALSEMSDEVYCTLVPHNDGQALYMTDGQKEVVIMGCVKS